MGRNATGLMQSTGVQIAIEALSVLGLFMMGILAGNYVKVESTLKFAISGRKFVIQEILDQIVQVFYRCYGCLLGSIRKRSESNASIALADLNPNHFSRSRNLIILKRKCGNGRN